MILTKLLLSSLTSYFCTSSSLGSVRGVKLIQLLYFSDKHPPVFDGTVKTIPDTLKNDTVMDEIEEANEGK